LTSRWTWTGIAATAVAFGGLVGFQGEPQAGTAEGKISQQVMLDTADGQETSFIIYMDEQADLSGASQIADEDARGWYVYNTLREQAEQSQAPLKAQLDAEGIPYKSYWAVNMIVAQGDRGDIVELAERPDVAAIETNEPVDGIQEAEEADAVEAVETGVTQTSAPELWNLGFKGEGIVVANQDTGMRWTHAALRTHYRGWGGTIESSNHNYNWWDSIHAQITSADGGTASPAVNPCGRNLLVPCDDNNHGTHTTGTAIGDDAGAGIGTGTNQIGVAPGAKWIGCRNMDSGNGRASTYTECFQFFLAPTDLTGAGADPTKRPHVMNNSWGCPQAGELCAPNVMKSIVETSEASGILVVASNGNSGSGCNTTLDPPAIYESSFSVGSITSANALSSFSSRGVVAVDGSNRMKPDLVARGGTVRSGTRTSDTAYGNSSGTSMAGPHVVGTVAVLWSARPNLVRDLPRTKWLLTRSANPSVTVPNNGSGCGGIGSVPNNHFGWGRVNVKAAYDLEPSLNQSITFAALPDRNIDDPDFALGATASSTLPVSYSASGGCTVTGNVVDITGPGTCTITASQAGLDAYSIAPDAPKPWYPAANVARSFEVTYSFAGFGPPVGKQNSTQAGSSFPVKFTLDGDRGLGVLASGYPRSKVCGAADATLVSTASAEPFSYASGQYKYVWKTDGAWEGQCRELVVKLDDNTEHRATFQFK
jgi:subtilisin family serine protease